MASSTELETPAQLVGLGEPEGNAGLLDLALGPDQALAHGRRRHQKGRRDGAGIETQHRLEHEGRVHLRRKRRVGAGEHEAQAIVGNRGGFAGGAELLGQQQQGLRRLAPRPAPARRVDQAAPRDRQQPGFGRARHALLRPGRKRAGEGVGQRVLRPGQIARARGEEGEELAVALARGQLDRPARILARLRHGLLTWA